LGRRRLRQREHDLARTHGRTDIRRLRSKPIHGCSDAVRNARGDALDLLRQSFSPRRTCPFNLPLPFSRLTISQWYGGNETGNAIADILFGNLNPSAKLPLSFPKRLQDNPAFLNYRTERGRALYGEDVYIGYRWYEMLDMPVLFPFGHGLSYTTFKFSDLKIQKTDSDLKVSVKVSNTGERAGAEVVQVYLSQKNPSIRRPKKELKGFKKVFLEKGESKVIEVSIETKYATSFWDEIRNAWVSERDTYEVIAGGSSDEVGSVRGSFEVEKTSWWNGL
jgi:beta-glucosidase